MTGKCSALSKNFNPDLDKDYLKETGIQAQQDFPGVSVEVTKLLMRFNRISKVLVLIILPKWIKLKPQAQQTHQEQSPQFPFSPKSSCPLPTPLNTKSSCLTMAVIGHKTICDHQRMPHKQTEPQQIFKSSVK